MSAREFRRQYSCNVEIELLRRTSVDSSIRSDYDGSCVTIHFAHTERSYRWGPYELCRAIIGVALTNKRVDNLALTREAANGSGENGWTSVHETHTRRQRDTRLRNAVPASEE